MQVCRKAASFASQGYTVSQYPSSLLLCLIVRLSAVGFRLLSFVSSSCLRLLQPRLPLVIWQDEQREFMLRETIPRIKHSLSMPAVHRYGNQYTSLSD